MQQQSAKVSRFAGTGAKRCRSARSALAALLMTAVFVLLGGCTTPSTERVESVRQRLEQARERRRGILHIDVSRICDTEPRGGSC